MTDPEVDEKAQEFARRLVDDFKKRGKVALAVEITGEGEELRVKCSVSDDRDSPMDILTFAYWAIGGYSQEDTPAAVYAELEEIRIRICGLLARIDKALDQTQHLRN